MKLKKGVKSIGLRPELLLALMVADGIYLKKGKELVVTSLNDGRHSETSLHNSGGAGDLRIRYFNRNEQQEVRKELKENLTEDYDVILESDHIHLEYQPRR